MSKKIIIGIVALIVIIGVWMFISSPAKVSPTTGNTQSTQTTQSGTPAKSVTTVTTVTTKTTPPTASTDTSDAAIAQDASNIDSQMNTLDSDNSAGDAAANNASQEK